MDNTNNNGAGGGGVSGIVVIFVTCLLLGLFGFLLTYFGKFFCPDYGYNCDSSKSPSSRTPGPSSRTPGPSSTTPPPPPSNNRDLSGTCQGTWTGDGTTCYSDWANGVITICNQSGNYRQTFIPDNPSAAECTTAPRKRIGSACSAAACRFKEPPVSGICRPSNSHETITFVPNNESSDPQQSGAKCKIEYDFTDTVDFTSPITITCPPGFTASPAGTVCNAAGVTGECEACGGPPPPPPTPPGAPPPPPASVAPTNGTCQQFYRNGPTALFFPNVSSLGGARCGASGRTFYDPTTITCPAGYTPSSHNYKCLLSSGPQTPDICGMNQTISGVATTGQPPLGCTWENLTTATGGYSKGTAMPPGCPSATTCN